jgi:hypothetical protein
MKRMMRSTLKTTVVILALLSPCGCLFTASAQGLTNTIPKNQAPLARTFLPTAAEQTPSGTGKFVIFTREETDKPNEWDFIAGAWECIPSRPEVPVKKRVEFCHSSWNADLLLDTLVRDDSAGLFPRFAQLQVDTGNYGSKVNLYDINYRTWTVRCLWQGERLSAFGAVKNSVYCQDSHDWLRLDATKGTISNNVPFIPLDVDGAFWLVRKIDGNSGVWSYDVAKEQFVGRFNELAEQKLAHNGSLLSADGKSRARLLIPMPTEWREDVIGGTFLLQRDGHAEDIRVHVMMRVKPVHETRLLRPIGTRLGFTKEGTVEFSANLQTNDLRERVWSIDTASGKISKIFRPYVQPKEDDFAVFDGVSAPVYLRPYLKNLRHFGRGGLAVAFLRHQGILKNQPEFPDCTAGVSRDGRHILYKAKEGPLANVLIYGDLLTKQTVRWDSPAGTPGEYMEFVWVETP